MGWRGVKGVWQLSRGNSERFCEGAGGEKWRARPEEEAQDIGWPVGRCRSSLRGADSLGEER